LAHPLIHFILSSYKLLRQLYPQMFGKTNASELPLPVSKAQPYLELFTLRFVWRQVGVKARYPVFRMPPHLPCIAP